MIRLLLLVVSVSLILISGTGCVSQRSSAGDGTPCVMGLLESVYYDIISTATSLKKGDVVYLTTGVDRVQYYPIKKLDGLVNKVGDLGIEVKFGIEENSAAMNEGKEEITEANTRVVNICIEGIIPIDEITWIVMYRVGKGALSGYGGNCVYQYNQGNGKWVENEDLSFDDKYYRSFLE